MPAQRLTRRTVFTLIPKRRSLKLLLWPKIQLRVKMISVSTRCLKFHKMISTLAWLQLILRLKAWISILAETTNNLNKQIIKDLISKPQLNNLNRKENK